MTKAPGALTAETVAAAADVIGAGAGNRLRRGVALAPLTSFRIGGPADLYLEVESDEDLAAVAAAVAATGLAWTVIGKGSNILVSDAGFRGLVLRLGRTFRWTREDDGRLESGAAMPLPALAGVALARRLTGLEFGVAIPGSVGGGIRMNAGAHGSSMSDVVETVAVYSLSDGARRTVTAADAGFAYRRSSLPDGSVVLGAVFSLVGGDEAAIRAAMDEARAWRRSTQPLAEPNCGSVFKNPPGDHAARLVEAVGGKDVARGGAAVSSKHANFIVTTAGATAADVLAVITEVRRRVHDRFGILLETEVQLLGDFDVAPV